MRRIEPLTTVVDLTSRRGSFRFRSRLKDPSRYVFTLDIYSHLRESHPETHVGWWAFPLPEGSAETTIGIDLTRIGRESLWRESPDGPIRASDGWWNPDYAFDPLLGIQLVLRRDGKVLENRFVTGKVADPEVLKSYYRRVHAGHGYAPSRSAPFLFELHDAMLARLDRLFLRHIPIGGKVLDAGCGRSLFTEIRPEWPFTIVASDVDPDLLRGRKELFPAVQWCVGAAEPVPFRDASFDALFAGELIEHLTDPVTGLREFARVLKPGGTLILTTPNRKRLANVVDRSDRPYSPDHLSELSHDEVVRLIEAEGFEIIRRTGVHLELFLNWMSSMPKLDRLQRTWNKPWAVPLMRLMLAAGGLVPRYAVDLIFVAKKR